MNDVWWMVALGIESRREREHPGWTKLHTKTAGFAALYDNRNTSFGHGISTTGEARTLPESKVIMFVGGCNRV